MIGKSRYKISKAQGSVGSQTLCCEGLNLIHIFNNLHHGPVISQPTLIQTSQCYIVPSIHPLLYLINHLSVTVSNQAEVAELEGLLITILDVPMFDLAVGIVGDYAAGGPVFKADCRVAH